MLNIPFPKSSNLNFFHFAKNHGTIANVPSSEGYPRGWTTFPRFFKLSLFSFRNYRWNGEGTRGRLLWIRFVWLREAFGSATWKRPSGREVVSSATWKRPSDREVVAKRSLYRSPATSHGRRLLGRQATSFATNRDHFFLQGWPHSIPVLNIHGRLVICRHNQHGSFFKFVILARGSLESHSASTSCQLRSISWLKPSIVASIKEMYFLFHSEQRQL